MENKTKCFCCGKQIKEDLDMCPHCGAEQVKLLTQKDVDNINRAITNLKKCVILGIMVGFISAMVLFSISPDTKLFLLGIIIGIASSYGLSSYYERKE